MTAPIPELERVLSDIEALIRLEDSTSPFVHALNQHRVIGGHPDTLARLRAAATQGELDGIRLEPIAIAERDRLYTGEIIAEIACMRDKLGEEGP